MLSQYKGNGVLHVIDSMDPSLGGVGQAVRTMANGLSELGVSNEIISLDDPAAGFLQLEQLKVTALGPGRGPWHYSKHLNTWLSNHLVKFSHVIVHGLWLFNGYATQKAFHRFKISENTKNKPITAAPCLYVMPHGMIDPYFQKANGRKLKALRNELYWQLIERKLVNSADGLLFTCRTEMELARNTFRAYKPKNEYLVGLGTEAPPVYTPAMSTAFELKCTSLQDQSYLLFLSRIHNKKGIDLLLHAYNNLRKKVQTLPKVVIAGPGLESAYGKQMQDLVQQQGLEKEIFFTGMLSGDAKWGAFYGCEAFVLPSHQENFGIAVVEAMACGKPVLISDQVNIWREIDIANAGLIRNDTLYGTESLLQSWTTLTNDQKRAMGQSARDCYKLNFGVELVAERMVRIFTSSVN